MQHNTIQYNTRRYNTTQHNMTQHNTIEYEITIIPIVKINLQVGKSRFADRTLNKQDMQNKNEELPSPHIVVGV